MKKKVALLLVLVMIVTSLPMIVFGNTGSASVQTTGSGDARLHSITLNANQLANASTTPGGLAIELNLTGVANAAHLRFPVRAGDTQHQLTVGAPLSLPVNIGAGAVGLGANANWSAELWASEDDEQRATIVLTFTGNNGIVPPYASGPLTITGIPVIITNDGGSARIVATRQPGGITLVDAPLAAFPGGGFNVQYGTAANRNPVPFSSAAQLNRVTVTERIAGQFDTVAGSSLSLIRLRAPRDYAWNTQIGAGFGGSLTVVDVMGTFSNTGDNLGGLAGSNWHNGYHYLYVWVNTARNNAPTSVLGAVGIDGLVLVPLATAPATGNVNINVRVGRVAAQTWTPGSQPANVSGMGGAFYNITEANRSHNNLAVATRTSALLELRTAAAPPTLRSGRFDAPAGGEPGAAVRAATIQVQELVPGAFDTGWLNSTLQLSLNQPGVNITGGRWRLYSPAPQGPGNIIGWQGFQMAAPGTPNVTVGAPGQALLQDNVFTLFVPRAADGNANRRLEIQFQLSIEAGFEWKYDSNEIAVYVGGNAVEGRLPASERNVVIARVEDPITLSLVDGSVGLDVAGVYNVTDITRVSDIVIQENFVGALAVGNRFVVEIAALPVQLFGALALTNATATVDTASGMVLSATNRGDHVEFLVVRQSSGTPATITLSNVYVMGLFFPGIQYVVSVRDAAASGTNITQNTNSPANTTVPLGRFDTLGYFAQIVHFETRSGQDIPTQRPPQQGEATSVILHSWDHFEGMAANQPSITQVGIAGRGVSMVAIRAFANVIDATEISSARNAAGVLTATIAAYNTRGEFVVVTIAENSPVAQISVDGVAIPVTDLATWAGPETGVPAGQLAPRNIGGNFFLPGRALANIFGYEVEFVNAHTLRFNP